MADPDILLLTTQDGLLLVDGASFLKLDLQPKSSITARSSGGARIRVR